MASGINGIFVHVSFTRTVCLKLALAVKPDWTVPALSSRSMAIQHGFTGKGIWNVSASLNPDSSPFSSNINITKKNIHFSVK